MGQIAPKIKTMNGATTLKEWGAIGNVLGNTLGTDQKNTRERSANSYIVHWISLHVLGIYTFNIYYLLVDEIRNIFFFKYYWHKKIKYIVLNIVKHYIRYNTHFRMKISTF